MGWMFLPSHFTADNSLRIFLLPDILYTFPGTILPLTITPASQLSFTAHGLLVELVLNNAVN